MAEPVAAVVMSSSTRNASRLNNYVRKQKKGQAEERFVGAAGINGASPRYADRQMRDNRKHWDKDGTRLVEGRNGEKIVEGEYVHAYHVIQSFAREGDGALDPDSPEDREKALQLGVALAEKVAGGTRYATVHTQIDGRSGCIHNHIVIDSIDKTNGRSFDSSNVKHAVLVKTHDDMLRELGYEQVNEYPEPGKSKTAVRVEKSEERGLLKHQLWEADGLEGDEPFSVAVLKARISETLEQDTFTDFDSFAAVAREHGVDAQLRGKGVSYAMLRMSAEGYGYRPIAASDKRRGSKLGRDFEKGAIESAIERNLAAERHRTVTPTTPAPPVPTYDRVPAALEDLWAEMAADDTPERVDELDRMIRSGGPGPRTSQSAEAEGDDIEPAPRRRRQRSTEEREEQVPTAPSTDGETLKAPEPAPRPVVTPEVAQGAPESSEGQQKPAPRAYTAPRPEKPAQPAAVPENHEHMKIDGFAGVDRRGLELIARQSGKQPSMVDFQLRAGTDAAHGHHGLSLNQRETPKGMKHGYVKISDRMLEQLEQAAGDNRVEVEGGHVLGVRADITYNDKHKLWLPRRFQESRLEPVTPDILDQQWQAERDAREKGLVSRSRQVSKSRENRLAHERGAQAPEIPHDRDRGYGLGD